MHTLVTVACALHNLSLAKAFGGPLFAQAALHPALLSEMKDEKERGRVMSAAWQNYSRINVPSHVLFTLTWLVERNAILELEVDERTQKAVALKDLFIAGALVTGLANAAVGGMIRRDYPDGPPVTDPETTVTTDLRLERYHRYFRVMGPTNLFLVGASLAIESVIGGGIVRSLVGRIFARRFGD
jgi:hypothetical protein